MKKNCTQCHTPFEITDEDLKFYDEVSPIFNGKKYQVPPPTFCPGCRQQRRLAWRNERMLYTRKCDATGKTIIAVYSPDKNLKVVNLDYWYADEWDGRTYGRDFDFSRPFFDQFKELMEVVPQLPLSAVGNQNSDYSNQIGWCKNCYLIFEADYNESCFYGNNIYDSNFCMDCLQISGCELCYECVDCKSCYNLRFSQDCHNCSDSWFLKNCIGCSNCFGSVNLRNKQYYFFNEKCTKEQYLAKIAQYDLSDFSTIQKLKEQFATFVQKFPQKYMHGVQNENSTGDYLNNTKNCHNCFNVEDAQDSKFVYSSRNTRNVYDMTVFGSKQGADFCYDNHEIGQGVRNVLFSDQVWEGCSNILYSKLCVMSSHDLFGCVGLKHASYCILNKHYTKEEYEKLMPKIIEHMMKTEATGRARAQSASEGALGLVGPEATAKNKEWGEFFPAALSPFGYNETIAPSYYPLTQAEALQKGFNWSDYEQPKPQVKKTIAGKDLPEIKDVQEDILDCAIGCEATGKPFRMIKNELEFYRKHHLPLPRKSPDQRHFERMALRPPRKLWHRACMCTESGHKHEGKCANEFETAQEGTIIYCEKCYLQAVD